MQHSLRRVGLLGAITLAAAVVVPVSAGPAAAVGTAYYVDCSASSNGSGTQSSPWNSLASVNAVSSFAAGDSILFKRASSTACSGMLEPKGSGTSGNVITIGAYGTGDRPVIKGGSNTAAIKLYNQSYWTIKDVETTGGNPHGILVKADTASTAYYGITISNVVVHDIGGTASSKASGGIVINPNSNTTTINNVLVENSTVYETGQWAGIILWNGQPDNYDISRSDNIVFKNNTVHDVGGDGIALFTAKNGKLESNLAYNTGEITTTSVGTPNGIWTWNCFTCVVQYNEAYSNSSPGVDGGAFDIDFFNVDNTVQYNYAHDNEAYCVAIFGAGSKATINSVVRYNICSNNGRSYGSGTGADQGDIYFATWAGGSLDGVQVYNNTVYWNPVIDRHVVKANSATFATGKPNFVKNNIFYSTVQKMINSPGTAVKYDNNLYYTTSTSTPNWTYNGTTYTGFQSYRSGSGQDANGTYADPQMTSPTYHDNGKPTTQFKLNATSPAIDAGTDVGAMGTRDFFGGSIPQNGCYDIGAHESTTASSCRTTTIDDKTVGSGTNQFKYTGTWSAAGSGTAGEWSGTNTYSKTTDDTATITFTGTKIDLYSVKASNTGKIAVSIDNGSETTVDLYAARRSGNELVWSSSTLTNASHTLKVRVTGTRNTSSTENWATVDKVVISKATVDDRTTGTGSDNFNYTGTGWGNATGSNTGEYLGTNTYSKTTDNYVTFTFTGTKLEVFGVKAPNAGKVAISVDNGTETIVDEYAATRAGDQRIWTSSTLTNGSHTVKLRVTGTKNTSSSDYWVTVDKVVITP